MGDMIEELLEKQLECAVCLGVYRDPRSLSCLHIFCRECLEHIPLHVNEDGQQSIGCPTCRKPAPLPHNGVAGFPVSFNTVQLLELLEKSRTNRAGGGGGGEGKKEIEKTCEHCPSVRGLEYCRDCHVNYCKDCVGMHKGCDNSRFHTSPHHRNGVSNGLVAERHPHDYETCLMHKKPLEIFCECCEDIICTSCIKKWPHSEHSSSCIPISEAIQRYKDLLIDRLTPLRKQIDLMSAQLKHFTCRESEIAEQSETVKAQIHSRADYLMRTIEASEKNLAYKVDQVIDGKLGALAEKKETIETTQEELKNLKENMELCLKKGNNEEILKTTKKWIPKIEQMIASVDASSLNPTEVADLSFVPDEVDESFSNLGNLSATFEGTDPRVNLHLIERLLFVDKSPEVSLVYSIQYTKLPFVIVPLSSIKVRIQPPPNARQVRPILNNGDSPNHYNVKFKPTSNGFYQVSIRVDDIHTDPQSILIPFNPLYFPEITPTGEMKNMRKPLALDVTRDKKIILISEFNELIVFNRFGGRSQTFTRLDKGGGRFSIAHRFTALHHVAITPDNCFLVADAHYILKLTMNCRLIATVGKRGTGPLQFDTVWCMTVDQKSGQIYVCDLNNHRIQVLNPDLTFSHSFGQKGSALGQLSQPNGVALDSNGDLFVTDTFNHRVQKFSHRGEFLFHFGSEGIHEGQFKLPEKIVINNGYIYITEHLNTRVSVYTTKGEFVRCFGKKNSEGGLQWPRGISFDEEGSLYVCDLVTARIVKY